MHTAEPLTPTETTPAGSIVVVGGFVVGMTVRLPRVPMLGETVVGDLFDLGPGGKGTNLAVAAVRQGQPVAMVGMVGSDAFGDTALDLYQREGIDARHVGRCPEARTAVGLVYLQRSGENTIGVFQGANARLTSADVEAALPAIRNASVVATELETTDEAVVAAVTLGSRAGASVLLNPAPARAIPDGLLELVDVLTPNASEARILAGLRPDDDSEHLVDIGRALLKRGAKAVAITLGRDGCLLIRPGRPAELVPRYPVESVDTVGAGDAFNGGLAVALARGVAVGEAVRRASITAALSTRRIGAVDGLPDDDEVAAHLAAWNPQSQQM